MNALIVAAGFLEPSDMPATVICFPLAYIASIALPFSLWTRWRLEKSERRKAMIAGIAIAIVSPFFLRLLAIWIQGEQWGDWHFIWFYLFASSLVVTAYLLLAGIWLSIRHAKKA